MAEKKVQITARQHTLPKCIQKHFTEKDSNIVWMRRRPATNRIIPTQSINVGVRRHIYSAKDEQGEWNTEYESKLSKAEGALAPAFDGINSRVKAGRRCPIEQSSLRLIARYIYLQRKRSGEVLDDLGDPEKLAAFGEWFFKTQHPTMSEAERRKFADYIQTDEAENDRQVTKLAFLQQISPLMATLLDQSSIAIARSTDPRFPYITGGCGVAVIGTGSLSDTHGMWMPISPFCALGIVADNEKRCYEISLKKLPVSQINQDIADHSDFIISDSKKTVAKVRFEGERKTPGEAQIPEETT